MQLVLTFATGAIVASYFVLRYVAERNDPREPPVVSSKIPFLGHVFGLIKKKSDYYVELYRNSKLPIYSINLGGQQVYIINSPDLIKKVQKQPKVFAFPPVAAHFSKSFCQTSKETNDIIDINTNGDDGDTGYVMSFYKMLTPSLAPGPGLDAMNRVMIENVANSLQSLAVPAKAGDKIQLSQWLRHEVTIATTNSVYGPQNPFKDPKVEAAFWEFNDDLGALLMNIVPALTASKGHRARKVVADAFCDYFNAGGHTKGSILVKNRYQNSVDNKISVEDIAKFEVGGAIAILVNTTPSIFWILFYIFAHPQVLRACREELNGIITTSTLSNGTICRTVDITSVKASCPLLTSIFAETLRVRGMALGVRKVMQDSFLDGRFLLKKDKTIMMPSKVVHTDPQIWGEDVKEFNPDRFMKQKATKHHDPAAFRGFGGGTTLCPGRHFATTEVLATAMMFVLRYDLEATNGWVLPTTDRTSLASAVLEPDTDVEVKLSVRPGFGDGEWAFGLKDSEMVFAIAAEDTA